MKIILLIMSFQLLCAYAQIENYLKEEKLDIWKARVMLLDTKPEIITKNLPELIKKLDHEAARDFLLSYLDFTSSQYEKSNRVIFEANVDLLVKNAFGERGQRVLEDMLSCKIQDSTINLESLINQVKGIGKKIECSELQTGEFDLMTSPVKNYLNQEYLLKRISDKKYLVSLNVVYENDKATQTTPKMMFERVSRCLKEVAPYMKGPQGEALEIKVLSPEELTQIPVSYRPRQIKVALETPNFRSNSGQFEEDIDCPAIVHESLHLLGLVDEYEDKDFPCRVVTKTPSIMSDQSVAFALNVPQNAVCSCQSEICQSIMSNAPEGLQNFYMSKNFPEASLDFRSRFCKVKKLTDGKISELKFPTPRALLTNDDGNKFEFENRNIISVTKYQRERIRCDCSGAGSEKCQRAKESLIQETMNAPMICPEGKPIRRTIVQEELNQKNFQFINNEILLPGKVEGKSILHPSHFARILGGACEEKASNYLKCAQYAYGSQQCIVPFDCHDDKIYQGD